MNILNSRYIVNILSLKDFLSDCEYTKFSVYSEYTDFEGFLVISVPQAPVHRGGGQMIPTARRVAYSAQILQSQYTVTLCSKWTGTLIFENFCLGHAHVDPKADGARLLC